MLLPSRSKALALLLLAGAACAQVNTRPGTGPARPIPIPLAPPALRPVPTSGPASRAVRNDLEVRLFHVFRSTPPPPAPGSDPGAEQAWIQVIELVLALDLNPGDPRDIALVVDANRRYRQFLSYIKTPGLDAATVAGTATHLLMVIAAEQMIDNPGDEAFVLRRARFLARVRARGGLVPAIRPFMDFVPALDGPAPTDGKGVAEGWGLLGTD